MAKYCPTKDVLNMLAKAFGWPGFGYKPPQLKIDGQEISDTKGLERQVDEVVKQVELLEWELRRVRLDRLR